ncbi:MAG: hypothetical protein IKT04_03135, partial [Clostridia bacterium]|nr:hypothetical protein [Clostridia bacterium]
EAEKYEKESKNAAAKLPSTFVFFVVTWMVLLFAVAITIALFHMKDGYYTTNDTDAFLIILLPIILAPVITYLNKKSPKNKKKKEEIKANVDSLEKKANEARVQTTNLLEDNYDQLSFIPTRYWSLDMVYYIIEMLETKRAYTLAQALELTDAQIHRENLEYSSAMQTAMLSTVSSNIASVGNAIRQQMYRQNM